MARAWAAGMLGWAALTLAACGEQGIRPTAVLELPDSADQVFAGFTHVILRDGLRRGRVEADSAFFYEARQVTRLVRARVTFHDDGGGEKATLTADRAHYFWQTGVLDAVQQVKLVAADGRTLATDSLHIDDATRSISTDRAFTYRGEGNYVTGTGLQSDLDFRQIVAGRPRGRTSKGFALPGQGDETP